MHNLLLIPITLSMLACQKPVYNITGQIKGLINDTLTITSVSMVNLPKGFDGNENARYDTITVTNGRFAFNLPVTEPTEIRISPIQLPGHSRNWETSIVRLFLDKGEQVRIDGQIDSTAVTYKLSGTRLNEDYSEYYLEERPFWTEVERLQKAREGATPKEEQLLFEKMGEKYRQMNNLAANYIKSNPGNPLAGYCLFRMQTDSIPTYYELLGDAARNSIFRPKFELRLNSAKSRRQIALAKESKTIVPGNPAPDFTLKKIDGTDFTLSSLRGKYVVLDFWGSWCGWCIKGIPEMKKYYDKYKGKFEIIGIACNDTDEKWRKAVAEYELSWINVINPLDVSIDQNLKIKYAVDCYPMKIILGPDGLIVAIVEGEDPVFYKKLDELMQ